MSIYLNVVFISQINYGNGMNDPTGCWFCSAEMIGKTYEQGPRQGVPELHSTGGHAATGSDLAHARMKQAYVQMVYRAGGKRVKQFQNTDNEHQLLAKRENLRPVEDHAGDWTLQEVEDLLRTRGPIFFYWTKTPADGSPSYGHASVLIGTDDGTKEVYYHDPEDGRDQTMPVDSFNALKQTFKWGMMRRNDVSGAALV